MEIRYEYPPKMPPGWHATPLNSRAHHHNSFSRTLAISEAARYLEDEILALRPTAATVYSAYQHLNNDRLRKKMGHDTAVSVGLKLGGKSHLIACDKWFLIEHNLYALHLSLRAVRSIEDWGAASALRMLSVFSPQIETRDREVHESIVMQDVPEWMMKLGLGPTATLEDANAVYRRRAKLVGNDEEALLLLNGAMDDARKHLR